MWCKRSLPRVLASGRSFITLLLLLLLLLLLTLDISFGKRGSIRGVRFGRGSFPFARAVAALCCYHARPFLRLKAVLLSFPSALITPSTILLLSTGSLLLVHLCRLLSGAGDKFPPCFEKVSRMILLRLVFVIPFDTPLLLLLKDRAFQLTRPERRALQFALQKSIDLCT